jgi:16S rRNA (guanine966-N2)-methyltransferase
MRIIGGQAGGRILKVPKGLDVRPTPDLVKQAIFNRLGAFVTGARVLELFAGSGALGLECLSRGATHVTAVELSRRHGAFIRQNLKAVGLDPARFTLLLMDVFAALSRLQTAGERFDLVMADPPFGAKTRNTRSESLSQRLLDDPRLPLLLTSEGCFVLGHTARDAV